MRQALSKDEFVYFCSELFACHMPSNIQRFERDLDALISLGDQLEMSMQHEVLGHKYEDHLEKKMGVTEAKELLNDLPDFDSTYESWYSETLVLIKQLIPDRLANFISMYEKPKTRKEILPDNYVIQDYLQNTATIDAGVDSAMPKFRQQLSMLKAASRRFASSLFEIRQLVQADLFDSEIDAARELLKKKFYRAAGAIAGVVLEKHLHQVCDDHTLTVKKNPGIGVLNEALKNNSVIDVPQWRHISMLGDIRNICDHSKSVEPTEQQIIDLIDGTDKVLKTIS